MTRAHYDRSGRAFAAASAAAATVALAAAGCSDSGDSMGPAPDSVPPPFRSAASCGTCHPQHLAEWEASMHAYGSVDPLMLAISDLARQDAGEATGSSCRNCHSAALKRQERWLAAGNTFSEEQPQEDLTQDGVSCDICHSFGSVPPVARVEFLDELDPRDPKRGSIVDPIDNTAHESVLDPAVGSSVQCAPCHQVNAANGVGLENTFREWQESILSGMGVECQECHMPAYTGPAALGGPPRTVHRHSMVGVDYAYDEFRGIDLEAQKEAIAELLRRSVTASLDIAPILPPVGSITVHVPVTNAFTGHAIPSGVSFAREMWVSLVVEDAAGATIYESGQLEADGDLPSSSDLVKFGAVMYDANGQPTSFTWRATSIDESGLIQYGQTRTGSWEIPVPVGTPGPLSVTATLRFRPIPPSVVRDLGLERLLPIAIFDMWSARKEVPLS